MKNKVEKLYSDINILIKDKLESKGNELRYRIGEVISFFYINHKNNFKSQSKVFEHEIVEFYNNQNLKNSFLDEKKYINVSVWDKIKTAISDGLSIEYLSDGYSITNVGYMQQFYRKYRNSPNSLDLALQLDWSHNVILIRDKINEDERRYYLKKTLLENWSVKELEKQIREESYDEFIKTIEDCNYKYKIDKLEIRNYKSLVSVDLDNLSPFLVFAGANATGKSSIFEALEFLIHTAMTNGNIALDIFGGAEKIMNFQAQNSKHKEDAILSIKLSLKFESKTQVQNVDFGIKYNYNTRVLQKEYTEIPALDTRIIDSFSRIFIDNNKRSENKLKRYSKLWLDASNLSKILKDILKDKQKEAEIIEWLQALIPEIEKVTVEQDLSGKEELQVYEKSYPGKPFTGNLISEGTFNIIAILALFYQSDEPQFICIEEIETGLNPAILHELVSFFKEMTTKKHHHIWLTTHSVSLVSELTEDELVIVNKKDGKTNVYPCKEGDFEEMNPGEAWMSNMLKGGGLPW
jgi:predicted ATPase